MSSIDTTKMDRTAFSVGTLADEGNDIDFWRTQSPEERLAALELMRQVMYGYDPTTARLQRVLEVVTTTFGGGVDGY